MAFTAKILSWRFRHLNIVGCLLKRRPTKGGGGSRAPQDPPSYAPVDGNLNLKEHISNTCSKILGNSFYSVIDE